MSCHPSPATADSLLHQAELLSRLTASLMAVWKVGQGVVTLPFDTMRAQYAQSVRAGLLPNSMLGSHQFGRAVAALEELTLGPFARRS